MLDILVIVLLVGLDQLVKYLVRVHIPLGGHLDFIPHVLGLSHLRNTGAAFSMLTGARWFFVAVTLAVVAGLFWVLLTRRIRHPLGRWMLVLVTAGAIGNLIDRAAFGYVVDMFETLFMNFPIFNVADIYVVVGGIGFALYYIFLHDRWKAAHSPEDGHGKDR